MVEAKSWTRIAAFWLAAGLGGKILCSGAEPALQPVSGSDAAAAVEGAEETAAGDLAAGRAPSLGALIAHALQYNDGLRAAHGRWRAALEAIPQAQSLPDPQLTYTYYLEQVETRVGPQRQRIGLAQMFPWFGVLRLRGDAAAKLADAAWSDVERLRLQLAYQVSVRYHDYVFLQRSIEVTRKNFELVKSLETVAREGYRTGDSLPAVMKAQVELGVLDDRLRSLEALRPALAAKLNAVLNREQHLPIPWPVGQPDPAPELQPDTILARLRQANPDLARLTTLAAREDLTAALARKKRFPSVMLGLSIIDTEDARMAGVNDSGKDPIMATIAVNLPIWHGKYQAEERQARYRQDAFLADRDDRLDALEADATMALYHYQDASRKIGLYRDTLLPKAEQSLSVAQQAFQAGKVDFLTLIDAQRVLLDFQLAVAKAQAERGKRLAELQMLIGADPRQLTGP